MHIAVICLPAAGHVNPTLPVVSELVRRGHRVTYATSEKYAKAVESAGATFFPSGEDLAAGFPRWRAGAVTRAGDVRRDDVRTPGADA